MPRLTRFTCPKCDRRYEVPPALTGLPLLCKGCGSALTVPDPPDEPEPEPEPPPPKPKPAPPVARPTVAPQKPAPPADDEDDKPYLIPEPHGSPDIDFNLPVSAANHDTNRTPAGLTPSPDRAAAATKPAAKPFARPKPPAAAPAPAPAAGGSRLIAVVVDAAVGLILFAAGAFLGEMLARKSTRQVWNDAGGAVSFPPVELIQWAAPPLLILLVYGLLAARGKTVGGWLRRRAG